MVLAAVVEKLVERLRVELDRNGIFAVTEECPGDAAGPAHRRRGGRSGMCARLDGERVVGGSHVSLF